MQMSLFDQPPSPKQATQAPPPKQTDQQPEALLRPRFEAAYNVYTLYQRGDMHHIQHGILFDQAIERGWLTLCLTTKNALLYERKV